jgi:hypothetical protein
LLFFAPVILLLFLLFVALGGEIVRQLWNWLLPSIFGLREITFWQALGILALCRILFGGFGLRGSGRSRMSTEQRERFRQRMRERFGFSPSSSESQGP